ncbi:MAG: hypothetical protein DYG89_04955 [Caldilinea sp. CFX5]|nr:hypothetical protein [Caldilinea sp. CFX5]
MNFLNNRAPLLCAPLAAPSRRWARLILCAVVIGAVLQLDNQTPVKAATCANVVVDSSLEEGSAWLTKSSGNYPILSTRLAHSGKQSAYLAGANNAQDLLATTLKLAPDSSSITLTFWWQIQSQEHSRFQDTLTVVVADAQGKALQNIATLSSREMSNQWQQRILSLAPFAGQTVQLQFHARTDAAAATDFFVDDVEVVVCN